MTKEALVGAMRQRVLDRLSACLPGLAQVDAVRLVAAANADKRRGLRELDAFLQRGLDVLVSASSDTPPGAFRLLVLLEGEGHPVRVPVCAECGLRRTHLPGRGGRGRVCQSCAAKARARPCARCGQTRPVAVIEPEGPLCHPCRDRDPRRHEPCSRCGRARRVNGRLPDGSPLCSTCHGKPVHICAECGRVDKVARRGPDGPLCPPCCERGGRQPRRCGRCGRTGRISVRGRDGGPDLCRRCNRQPVVECAGCKRLRPCAFVATARPLCVSCRPRRATPCARCGTSCQPAARWPIGGVCRHCYRHARANPSPCPSCGKVRVLVAADFRGRDVCGPCAGTTIDYTCRTCGQAEERYRHGECVRCVARSKLEDQFRRPDGSVPAELTPLLAALAAAHRPRSVLAWVERGDGSAALLRDLVRSGCAITHEALDAATRQQAAAALREMLVHAGVLPRRDEQLERLAPWLSRTLATAPAHHRQVLRAYGNWSVLRRARLRADRTRFTAASARNARLKVSTALTFLRWLDTTDLTLERARQAHVDTWIEDGGLNRRLLGDFLTWASRRGLAQKLSVAAITPSGPDLSMTEDQRWALLDRLLHDTTISVDVRTAASLLLIYGLPVTFIATLTTDNVTTSGGKHFLQVKEHRTQLPPAVAALITQAASAARTSSLVGRAVPGTPWLFPGRLAGRPISAAALCQRLRQHGIRIRRARNSALISLAEDLPAPVLSKILGISITAAIRWTRYARRDWLPFVGERAASAASRSQR